MCRESFVQVIWTNRLSTDNAIFIALTILDMEAENICHHANASGISGFVEVRYMFATILSL